MALGGFASRIRRDAECCTGNNAPTTAISTTSPTTTANAT
jgi:hypothetical protein